MCSLLSSAKYLLLLVTLARAMYYIDDTNSTIQYTPSSAWNSVSDANSFNGTMTYVWEHTPGDRHIIIPFTGSGITIYVFQPNTSYMNVSIVIDGGPPTIQTIFPNETKYNVSLYDVQSLSFSGHQVDIALQFFNNSHLFFDYAVVNDTQPSPTSSTGWTSTSTSKDAPTSESTFTSTKPSKKHIGAIIGGVVGALAMIITMIGVAFLSCRRWKKAHDKIKIDSESKIKLFNTSNQSQSTLRSLRLPLAHDVATAVSNVVSGTPFILPDSNGRTLSSSHVSTPDLSNKISGATVASMQLAPDPPLLETNTAISSSHNPAVSIPFSDALSPSNAGHMASGQLTIEQLVTLQTLYNLNTPAAEIVGVMQRMRASRHPEDGPSSSSGPGLMSYDIMQDPPEYDSIPPGGSQ